MIKRRTFIAGLGSAAAWPLAAAAQQPVLPEIGFLNPRSPDTNTDNLRTFRQSLKDTGYVDGENVSIVYRFGDNQTDRMPVLAAELVRRRVTVIVTTGGTAAHFAAKTATAGPITGHRTAADTPMGERPRRRWSGPKVRIWREQTCERLRRDPQAIDQNSIRSSAMSTGPGKYFFTWFAHAV